MLTMDSKYGTVKVYAKTIEKEAVSQVYAVANSPVGENAHIRIMPDAHAGAGCVIGTTMVVKDKVCPNLVGVDIGCGVDFVKTDIDFLFRLDELDRVIRDKIPFGTEVHNCDKAFPFEKLRCWDNLTNEVKDRARKALGTLGGGNHFIEAYENGGLAVHSGSRNIGLAVAKYYQRLAEDAKVNPLYGTLYNHATASLSNAQSLISVKDSGNVTTSRCPHSENILSPIVVTPSAIINLRTGISSSPE